jgi:pyruvate kinase
MKHAHMARVVCTIGPSTQTPEKIEALIKNGMNVARLNFSHGTHESHREIIHSVRTIAKKLGAHVGILQDLCGPKIRLGMLPESGVPLVNGGEIRLRSHGEYTEGVLPVVYDNIERDVRAGEPILLADGLMELEAVRIEGTEVVCKVVNGGTAYSRKGVNFPKSSLSIAAFSEKDRADFEMGLAEEVDFVALSFVRDAADLGEILLMIEESPHKPKLIAKIEKQQAVDNIHRILEYTDGVMVARGDLGVEVPLERVPIIQKNVIRAAKDMGKIVITATQMLASMVSSPRPTRGETSDVANAILDGTDAVMLSDETASGNYPVEACAMLANIASATEPYMTNILAKNKVGVNIAPSISLAVGRAAGWLAAGWRALPPLTCCHNPRKK